MLEAVATIERGNIIATILFKAHEGLRIVLDSGRGEIEMPIADYRFFALALEDAESCYLESESDVRKATWKHISTFLKTATPSPEDIKDLVETLQPSMLAFFQRVSETSSASQSDSMHTSEQTNDTASNLTGSEKSPNSPATTDEESPSKI